MSNWKTDDLNEPVVKLGESRFSVKFIKEVVKPDEPRLKAYQKVEDYFYSEQNTELTQRAREYLEACGYHFCDNFMKPIVNTLASRLKVEGFSASASRAAKQAKEKAQQQKMQPQDPMGMPKPKPKEPNPTGGLTSWASDLWDRNHGDEEQMDLHRTTLLLGDAFVICDWSDTGPTFSINDPRLMKVKYDPADHRKIIYAAKKWDCNTVNKVNPDGDPITRLNLYADDRVEKYYLPEKGGEWLMWNDEGDEEWPVMLLNDDGTPRGIPVFHFRNALRKRGYGESEIRDHLPMQDFLNKSFIDLAYVMDAMAWPQRWGTGIASGEADKLKIVPGNMWSTERETAKFGQFEAAEPKGLLDTILTTVQHLAGTSHTPMHQFVATSGDMPSGEALLTAEAGLVQKAEERQTIFGNCWEDVLNYCLRLQVQYGEAPEGYDESDVTPISVTWKSPESRTGTLDLQAALLKKQIGVSTDTILSELGYDPEDEHAKKVDEQENTPAWMQPGFGAAGMLSLMERNQGGQGQGFAGGKQADQAGKPGQPGNQQGAKKPPTK